MSLTNTRPHTKSSIVIALLSRTKGATIDEICKTANWKQHSVRAFLAGLRKKGYVLVCEHRCDDGTAYRITQTPAQKTELAAS